MASQAQPQRCRDLDTLASQNQEGQRWIQSREFCGVAWRCSTESSLRCRKSNVLERIVWGHLYRGTCKHDRISCFILSSHIAAMMFWTSPMKYFYAWFFKASIYFYLFEYFSIVLSTVVFSTGVLPGPEKIKRLHMMTKQRSKYPKDSKCQPYWAQSYL